MCFRSDLALWKAPLEPPADELAAQTCPCKDQFDAEQSSRVCPGSYLAAHFPPNHPMPLTCCPPHCNCISLEQSSPLRQVFKDPEKKSSLVKSTAAVGLTKGFQLLKAMGPEAHAMALTI